MPADETEAQPGSLASRWPPDATPEAQARFMEIAALAGAVTRRLNRPTQKFDEPAAVFDLHTRPEQPAP